MCCVAIGASDSTRQRDICWLVDAVLNRLGHDSFDYRAVASRILLPRLAETFWYGSEKCLLLTVLWSFLLPRLISLHHKRSICNASSDVSQRHSSVFASLLWCGWLEILPTLQIVQQFALVGLLEAAVWTFLGIEIVRLLAHSRCYLFSFVSPYRGESGPTITAAHCNVHGECSSAFRHSIRAGRSIDIDPFGRLEENSRGM